MQTNVLIKEEYILKNKNKSCPYKKLSVFYNSCLKTFRSHLVLEVLTAGMAKIVFLRDVTLCREVNTFRYSVS